MDVIVFSDYNILLEKIPMTSNKTPFLFHSCVKTPQLYCNLSKTKIQSWFGKLYIS